MDARLAVADDVRDRGAIGGWLTTVLARGCLSRAAGGGAHAGRNAMPERLPDPVITAEELDPEPAAVCSPTRSVSRPCSSS